MLWHCSLFPSMHCSIAFACVSQRSSWWWRPLSAHGGLTGWFFGPRKWLWLLANIEAVLMCLTSLHKSILSIVQMSVLHDICRAWFWVTEGRKYILKGIQTVPTCCGPLKRLQRDQLRLRADTCHSEEVQRQWLLQCKGASCHTNCCRVSSFWFHRKLLGAAVWNVTPLFLCLFRTLLDSLMLSLPFLSMLISIHPQTQWRTQHISLFFQSPNLQ